MNHTRKIQSALISVFHKDRLEAIVQKLAALGVKIYSTGGTQSFIEAQDIAVTAVEDLTGYPSILGGRVKTLHPKVFGGILNRRENTQDQAHVQEYDIPSIDLVIVDLYPFEQTVASGASEADIIEKIDIGGISLIRAAAKNYADVLTVSSQNQYDALLDLLEQQNGETSLEDRRKFAADAFDVSSHYDTAIYNYFQEGKQADSFKYSIHEAKQLRYGENPHQVGFFYGKLNDLFDQLHGKEISYNNLLDIEAAVNLIAEFTETTFAIMKHNNACGLASRPNLLDAWMDALAGDPVSAFGGVLICNRAVDEATAEEVNKLFFEIIIAPSYDEAALRILKKKKKRIVLIQKEQELPKTQFRTLLNGVLMQERDLKMETADEMKNVTESSASEQEIADLVFANKLVKHSKSNTIVLAKNGQLFASGVGQTSRVDALKQAIHKAESFHFDLKGAAMASDAFFPFKDSVEIAYAAGIRSVVQPGGSIRDQETIDFCNENNIAMVFTGIRHFKH